MLTKQVETGLKGLVTAIADGSVETLDPEDYEEIPTRVFLPAD
jgi:hypothetical protein